MTKVAEDPPQLGPSLTTDPIRVTYGMTVREVLDLPALRQARVLAGAAGLHRSVQRLGIWETDTVLSLARPDEMLVTTGFPLLDQADRLPEFLTSMARAGVAAVAVKLGEYVDRLPEQALRRADELDLPVLDLAAEISLADVLHQVLTTVLGRQTAVLERSEEIHRALVQVVLGGGGLPEVARAIADGLGLSVVVTDAQGRIAARAGGAGLADLDGAVQAGRLVGDGRVVLPVLAGGVTHGHVVAVAESQPITAQDVHALERAVLVCALVSLKQQAVSAVEERYQADFLRDVLLGRVEDRAQALRHAATLGWRLDRPMAVVVAQPDDDPAVSAGKGAAGKGAAGKGEPLTDRLCTTWRMALRPQDAQVAVCGYASEVVALVGAPPEGDFDRLVRGLTAPERSGARRQFTVGISRVVDDITGIPEAYEQARTCVRVARQVDGPGSAAQFDRLGVHRLLSLVPATAELRSFLDETLGELAGPDAAARDLRRTLEVLLETNLNVAETARRLHFHYNTLRYRIGKLERILGPFTEDADLRLALALALRIMPMRGLG
jgi:PucR family transcriptional regulator, purine catabolism regulatory protein